MVSKLIINDETKTPITAAARMEIGIAREEIIFLFEKVKTKARITAAKPINIPGSAKLPRVTKVEEATIIPLPFNPTKRMKPPKQAEMMHLKSFGIDSIIIFLIGVNEKAKKITPATVRRIMHCCHE